MNRKIDMSLKRQRGAAVLVISISLLLAVTLLLVYASRVGLLDQKMSGNEYRHKTSFANAEAGADQAASFLRQNPNLDDGLAADGWATCTGSTTIFPCNLAGATDVFATVVTGSSITSTVATAAAMTNSEAFLVKTADSTVAIGRGTSDDGTGESIVQVEYSVASILTPGEVPPLMMPTGNLTGSFEIVPNPDAGEGYPVSIWANTTLTSTTGTWATCQHGEFEDSGSDCIDVKSGGSLQDWGDCSCTDALSEKTNLDTDIVKDANYPASSFAYVFNGKSQAEVKSLAQSMGLVLADCSSIVADFAGLTASRLVWVEGDCTLNNSMAGGTILGTRAKPILLVVEGDIDVNGNIEIWGVVVGLQSFSLNGGVVMHGSSITELGNNLTNGTYAQVYDQDVFDSLRDDSVNTFLTKQQYSWRDFTP